jgi:peptide/nickel transport system substrate-binding protein
LGFFDQNLLRLKPRTYEVEPELGQRWEQPSETQYIFTLAPNVKWHNKPPANGRALTAEDIAFSLRRIGTDEPRFVNKSLVAGIDRVEAVNATTVRITTKQPDVSTLVNLADWNTLILAPEVVDRAGRFATAETAVGTGAFVLQAQDDVSATLVRNPDYWKSGLPYLDGLRLAYFADDNATWAAYLAGQVDTATVPGTEVKKFVAEQGQTHFNEWVKDIVVSYLWLNTRRKPFDDPRVTRALRLLMDHDEFISGWANVWFGEGSGGHVSHLSPALEAWDFTQDEYKQARTPLFLEWKQPKDDAAREALSLLRAAGFTRENPLKFELAGNTGTWQQASSEVMQAQWRRLGQGVVDAELKLYDNTAHRTLQARGEFDAAGPIIRGTHIDPEQTFRQYYHTSGGNNFGKYSDPRVDQMIDRQRTIFDVNQRKAAVKEVLTYLIQNAPYTGSSARNQLSAAQPKVKNFAPENLGYVHGFIYEQVWLDV